MRLTHPVLLICIWTVATQWGCRSEPPAGEADPTAVMATETPATPDVAPTDKVAPLCTLTGGTADEVSCPLILITEGTPAAGLQLRVNWDPKAMIWTGIRSERCTPGGDCKDVMSPPYTTVGTHGHSLVTSKIEQAKGSVTLMIVHSSKPDATLKSDLGALVFKLRRTILERDASAVNVSDIVVTSASAITLPTRVDKGRIRVGQ